MKNINQENLIKNLNELNTRPDRAWQERTLARLQILEKDSVTNSSETRNNFHSLFNFLFINTMELKKVLATTALVFVGGTVLTTVTIFAAQGSKPGDPLYGFDKTIENIQRTVTIGGSAKSDFEVKVLNERLDELTSLDSDNSEHVAEALKETQEQQEAAEKEIAETEKNGEKVDPKTKEELQSYQQELQLYLLKLQTKLANIEQSGSNPKDIVELQEKITKVEDLISSGVTIKPSEVEDRPEVKESPEPTEKPEPTKVTEHKTGTSPSVKPTEKPEPTEQENKSGN
jgi:hypothetical protein